MCELSIVIVNWNGGDDLIRTLKSVRLALGEMAGAEIILIDNASSDGSAGRVAHCMPDVCVQHNARNVGFGAANNLAFRWARGRFILILNPDTMVERCALQKMIEFMASHPCAGICGPKILEADGKTISPWCARRELFPIDVFIEYAYLYRLFPQHRLFGRYTMGDWSHDTDRQVSALSGACMLVRREALEQVGGFDARFFMYGEDVDWCRRFRQQGWQVWFVAGASIRHAAARSTRQTSDRGTRWAVQSVALLFRKHGDPIALFKAKLALSTGCLIRSCAWLCCGMIGRRHARYAIARSASYLMNSLAAWIY